MLPVSEDEKGDEVTSSIEEYHEYKRKYVKHLFFNPDEEELSKGGVAVIGALKILALPKREGGLTHAKIFWWFEKYP